MAENYQHHESKTEEPCETAFPTAVPVEKPEAVESTDRGLFDFLGKKKEEGKTEDEAIAHDFGHKVHLSDDPVKSQEYYSEEPEKKPAHYSQEPAHHEKPAHYEEPEKVDYVKEEPVHYNEEPEKKIDYFKDEPGYSKDEPEKKHESLAEKLHRSNSSSSSSSDEEEVGEDGLKKKKKKGLKEKLKEKLSGGDKKEEAEVKCEDTHVPVEKYEEVTPSYTPEVTPSYDAPEEKKGFLEKIKDKIPGGKKTEEADYEKKHEVVAPPPVAAAEYSTTPEVEKKGFLDKIKEKLPGYHAKGEEEKEKEKEKEKDSY